MHYQSTYLYLLGFDVFESDNLQDFNILCSIGFTHCSRQKGDIELLISVSFGLWYRVLSNAIILHHLFLRIVIWDFFLLQFEFSCLCSSRSSCMGNEINFYDLTDYCARTLKLLQTVILPFNFIFCPWLEVKLKHLPSLFLSISASYIRKRNEILNQN